MIQKIELPYRLDALEPYYNAETLNIHYNILYKGYVMSDYNKHKQRTAVRNLREYIAETTENPDLETEILEVGDGLAVTKIKSKNPVH